MKQFFSVISPTREFDSDTSTSRDNSSPNQPQSASIPPPNKPQSASNPLDNPQTNSRPNQPQKASNTHDNPPPNQPQSVPSLYTNVDLDNLPWIQ